MSISADDACEVLRAYLQPGPDEVERRMGILHARPIGSSGLWSAQEYEEFQGQLLPLAGAAYVVGPDRKLWVFSSNPGIHDLDLAITTLERLYRERLAAHVEPDRFAARLREVTEQRARFADELVAAARSGALKTQRRVLP